MPEFIRSRLGDNQEANVIGQGLQYIMEASESDRAQGLAAFRGMAAATQALFQLEHARLQARLGEGHPRVEALALRLRANAALLPAVDAALGEARTPEPAAKPDRAVIHGRVVDTKLRGLEAITVAW
ncbi:MAG TPA: hypothetical protein VK465_10445, partial [Fibrobacteria bacterium]|nr:hypothetical protein [Fibrobacteria bacterium]